MRSSGCVATVFLCLMVATGCGEREVDQRDITEVATACDTSAVLQVVERFGQRLKDVSLLAPDSIVSREMAEAYDAFVTDSLLQDWLSDPAKAPGRTTSSPWPDRIEVMSVRQSGADLCSADGEIVWMTSAGEESRTSVRVVTTSGASPRITEFTSEEGEPVSTPPDDPEDDRAEAAEPLPQPPVEDGATAAPEPTSADAVAVVRRFHELARAGEFRAAYDLWEVEENAEEPPFEEFAEALAATEELRVEVGEPGRVEPAAGSRYVRIPSTVHGVMEDGTEQRYEVTYTLRRSVVPGASPEQRRWRIYGAEVLPLN